ncbi:MAG: ATP-binding protein [Pseudomonadales bacterium]
MLDQLSQRSPNTGITKSAMFRSQLLWRLYAGYVTIILCCTLIVGVLVGRQVTENGMRDIQQSLVVRSKLLAQVAKPTLLALAVDSLATAGSQSGTSNNTPGEALQDIVVQLGRDTHSRLSVIDVEGRVIADSMQSPELMDNHARRPEIIAAWDEGAATAQRFSETLQQQMIYRALQVTNQQNILGFVRVSLPRNTIENKLAELRQAVVFGAGLSAFAALILGFFFAKRFSDPLAKMTVVAEAISQGDYTQRIRVDRQDEIGQMAEAFNRIARSSAQRMAEITNDHNRLAMIFSGMVEGVIVVDPQQKIIQINQAAARVLDLSLASSLGKPIWEQVRVAEINTALEQTLDSLEVVTAQIRRPLKAGDRVIDISAAALRDEQGDPVGAVIVLHDISELDRLERIRRDFVGNASHELKTPITVIRGLAETILDDEDMDPEVRRRFTEKISTQSHRLSQLVTDLMTLSRLESDTTEKDFQHIDLEAVVKHSIVAVKDHCQEKELSLTLLIEAGVSIVGDLQTITQLIDNLIDNAIKYTPAGGEVGVKLYTEQGVAILRISDSGIGISPQHQQRIFERFYRVDKARSRDLGGTGLGLSIVKNIAEQHGGSVQLESQLGAGSVFTVSLPLQD